MDNFVANVAWNYMNSVWDGFTGFLKLSKTVNICSEIYSRLLSKNIKPGAYKLIIFILDKRMNIIMSLNFQTRKFPKISPIYFCGK